MSRSLRRWTWWVVPALAAGALSCESRVVDIQVKVVTTACVSPPPLQDVTQLKVRVSGDGLTPMETTSSLGSDARQVRIPEIPAGNNRVVEVRALTADGKLVSMGRSLAFKVPDAVPAGNKPLDVVVFLRRVNRFTPPSAATAPASCSIMRTPRAGHTATLLKSGQIFVAGGYQLKGARERVALAKTELYNPATGLFEEGPDLGLANSQQLFTPLARAFHTATMLPNTQVLIWGGEGYLSGNDNGKPAAPWASVLVYDADQRAFGGVPFKNLPGIGRAHHAAAVDDGGRVLIVGGANYSSGNKILDSVEWFDPSTLTGKLLDGVSLQRVDMAVAPLQSGKFIAVAGGTDGTTVKTDVSFFQFDPSGTFKLQGTGAQLREGRRAAGVASFRDAGDVLLVGGSSDAQNVVPLTSTEIVRGFAVSDGPAVGGRGELCLAQLPDGRVLAVGGRTVDGPSMPSRSDATVELIVPSSDGTASVLGKDPLPQARYHHTCTTLGDGTVLVLGGLMDSSTSFEVLQDALIFQPDPLD